MGVADAKRKGLEPSLFRLASESATGGLAVDAGLGAPSSTPLRSAPQVSQLRVTNRYIHPSHTLTILRIICRTRACEATSMGSKEAVLASSDASVCVHRVVLVQWAHSSQY
jgi:hypothetical protein